jgi:phospholipid-binding lipoprotein MlaA
MFLIPRAIRTLVLTLLLPLVFLGGCATTHPQDPFEPVNRVVYQINDGVDTVLLRPLAQGYRAILPQFVRNSISNFFSNINDILNVLNNLLQGKPIEALNDFGRVAMNSTLGLGGLLDIASEAGMEKHNEDFGQTLGRWGIGSGPYLVLPLLGPSTVRDAVGRFVDSKTDPLGYMHDVRWRNSLWGTRFVNSRAELLDTSRLLETASLDPYEFLRDAYLQRRRNLIYDGSPPREKDEGAGTNMPATQTRHDSPFPWSAESEHMLPGTPWPGPDQATPARATATEQSPVTTVAPAKPSREALAEPPRAQFILPTEPPAAGAMTPQPTASVVRVWPPAAD